MSQLRSNWLSPKSCLVLALVLMLSGCKKNEDGKSEEGRSSQGSGYAKVTYQPEVHTITEEETKKTVRGISSDGMSLVFDAANTTVASLQSGDVLIMQNLAARTVVATAEENGLVLVMTREATIPEIVKDGQIHVDAPIHFGTLQADYSPPKNFLQEQWANLWPGTVYAQDDIPQHGAYDRAKDYIDRQTSRGVDKFKNLVANGVHAQVQGWDTTFAAKPDGGKVNISVVASKNINGFVAKITGEGYISDFDFSSDVMVEQQTNGQRLQAGFRKINGVMNFTWEIATDKAESEGGGESFRVKLPAALSIPLAEYLGGLPVSLNISTEMIIKPALSAGKEYSHGAFRINFGGSQHFDAHAGTIDSDGNVTGDIQILADDNISALAPFGVVIAMAVPRIELSLGLTNLLPLIPMDNLTKAADWVDSWVKRASVPLLLSPTYRKMKPDLEKLSVGDFVKNVATSNAAAFFEFVASSGLSYTGSSVITPCSRNDVYLLAKVGAGAQAFGHDYGSVNKEVFNKQFTRVSPAGMKLCDATSN